MKIETKVIEQMARIGFESQYDEKWDRLHPKSIERDSWKRTAKAMIDEMRRMWEEEKERVKQKEMK